MLSRLALRHAQLLPSATKATQAMASSTSSDQPLYQRPVRLEYPGKVRFGFIPDEWFTFFYNKTGVTGGYMFGISALTYLFSKEIYICDHEFYVGLSYAAIWITLVKKLGPPTTEYLNKEREKYTQELQQGRDDEISLLKQESEDLNKEIWRTDLQNMIFDAKRENIKMQLEAAYRERLATVYSEVKKRLDYQLQISNVERRIAQKHMAQWIINNVLKAITPDQEKATLAQCIKDLKGLAPNA